MTCSICQRPDRAEIDEALVMGEAERSIAKRCGTHSSSVHRHRECIREDLKAAQVKRGTRLLQRVERLADKLERLADECETEKQRGAFLMTARELRPTFLLMGQLNGEIVAASVQGFLAALGVTHESEVRAALDLARSGERVTLEDFAQELEAGLRLLRAERPEEFGRVMRALSSGAEVLPASANGHGLGNGASPR